MKRIIIAGAHSYIGTRLEQWLARAPGEYAVRTLDLKLDSWRADPMAGDALLYVAAIVHQPEREKNAALYYQVNRDLALEAARRAKAAGVGQFLYMSSMSVYGLARGAITPDTVPAPNSHYGRSKLEAEALLMPLADARFHVAVLRPPLVFGPGCKGNYPRLSRLAQKLALFPDYPGTRSMVYIDHLCEAIRQIVDWGGDGCFYPQDPEYYNVPRMMAWIRDAHGKTLRLAPGLGGAIHALSNLGGAPGKVFASLTYARNMPGAPGPYHIVSNEEAVRRTETGENT